MQLFTLIRLLPFLLFVNLLSAQITQPQLHIKHPETGNTITADKFFSMHTGDSKLNDSFIDIARNKHGGNGLNYFAVTNGTPVIESKFAIPAKPEDILRDYILEFRRCNYPLTIHRINDTTYLFTGEVGDQVKKVLLAYDNEKQISMCNFSCQTDDYGLMKKCQITCERFPELSQMPGERIYYKEYHQGPIISICAKVQIRGSAELAMDEVAARLRQFGWQSTTSKIANHQDFAKNGANARVSAIDDRYNSTAVIVISDQSQLAN